MNVLDPVTQHHIRQAAEALTDEFAGIYSQETIREVHRGVARPAGRN